MDIKKKMDTFHVPGVSIAYFDNGEMGWTKEVGILSKNSLKNTTNESMFHACSVSKMITALCVLRLVQDDILDLSHDVNEYLKDWKIDDNVFTKERKCTLANLLSHQAGFYDAEDGFSPYIENDAIPNTLELLEGTTRYNKEIVVPKYVPETDFAYSDAGYCVIEQVVKDVTGHSIPYFANQFILKPLGLNSTFFWGIDKTDDIEHTYDVCNCAEGHDKKGQVVEQVRACYPNIEGAALWSTPSELAVIVLDILKSYHDDSGIILEKKFAEIMLTPFGVNFMGMGVFLGEDDGEPYFFSQGWGVGMQCKLKVYPKVKKGIVVMTNSDPGMEQDKALVGEIIDYVCIHNRL